MLALTACQSNTSPSFSSKPASNPSSAMEESSEPDSEPETIPEEEEGEPEEEPVDVDAKMTGDGESAVGCYLNFLETEQHIFLPVFEVDMDSKAIDAAKDFFNKTIIPVNVNEIAVHSGVLNCISWGI